MAVTEQQIGCSDIWGSAGVVAVGAPVLFRNCSLGNCLEKWNSNYFREALGTKRIAVHVSTSSDLSFLEKNFAYENMDFNTLLDHVQQVTTMDERSGDGNNIVPLAKSYYFRALGERPTKDRAQLKHISPQLQEEFVLPAPLALPAEIGISSSVLRLTSPGVALWGHYDIPDNFLAQVRGRKKVRLFPPSQVSNLYITGSSSPVKGLVEGEVDLEKYPKAKVALRTSVVACVEPGDILFIPSCWIHATRSYSVAECREAGFAEESMVINVNVFFWNNEMVEKKKYDMKDIYGNKDLTAFQKMEKLLQTDFVPVLEEMPSCFKNMYIEKIVARLKQVQDPDVHDQQ